LAAAGKKRSREKDVFRLMEKLLSGSLTASVEKTIASIANALSAAIINYCSIVHPDIILLGGRTTNSAPRLLELVQNTLSDSLKIPVEQRSSFNTDAWCIGSAFVMFRRQYKLFGGAIN
jgi:predicted NBD/HSP70 family sugar kinase